MNIQLVGVHQVDEVWPAVRGHIEKAIRHCDDLSLSGLYTYCRSGQGFLFVSDDLKAALIFGFQDHNGEQVGRIMALGSSVHTDWKTHTETIRRFAYANGASKLIFEGRKGWGRVFQVKPKRYYYEV